MAYPVSAPSYPASDVSMTLADFAHLSRHQTMEGDIVALAAKVGTGASTAQNNYAMIGTGAGTSAWTAPAAARTALGVAIGSDVQAYISNSTTGTGNIVRETSPTIVTPTIASFTNATHNHTNAAGGGTLGTAALVANSVAQVRLSSTEATDLHSGTAITAATWTDFRTNQNFDVTGTDSVVVIVIRAKAHMGSTSVAGTASSRLVVDSAGTPIIKYLGGDDWYAANTYANPFGGTCVVVLNNLSAGTHTVKPQVWTNVANVALYARHLTVANEEFFTLEVIELKR